MPSSARADAIAAKPLVTWVIMDRSDVQHQPSDALGIVHTNGRELAGALVIGAKRFRRSTGQLRAVPWDEAKRSWRVYACAAERKRLLALEDAALNEPIPPPARAD